MYVLYCGSVTIQPPALINTAEWYTGKKGDYHGR